MSTSIINAQELDSVYYQHLDRDSYFTFDIFSSINTFSPRWRIGYIRNINSNWKAGLNIGYGNWALSYTRFTEKTGKDYQLWEIRPEIYHVFNPKNKTQRYLSVEIFYIHHQDLFHNDLYQRKSVGLMRYDQANYLRHKYGFNLNVGEFVNIGNRFGLNLFTGLGIRIRDNSFSEVINPTPEEEFRDMFYVTAYKEIEGIKLGLNLSAGIRLYLR
jgi:hypothetical protein